MSLQRNLTIWLYDVNHFCFFLISHYWGECVYPDIVFWLFPVIGSFVIIRVAKMAISTYVCVCQIAVENYFSSLLKSLITEKKDATKSCSCSRKSWSVKDKNHQKQCGNTWPAAASYSSFISKWMMQDYLATSSFSNDLYVLKSCYLMRLFNTEHMLKTPFFFSSASAG